MNWKKIILTSIVLLIVRTILTFLTCGWLFNWVYTLPPNIWLTGEQITSGSNFLWSTLIGFVIVIVFTAVFAYLYDKLPKTGYKKGLVYGLIVWLMGSLGMATMPFYMTIHYSVVVYWILLGLVRNLLFGAIVGAMYKK